MGTGAGNVVNVVRVAAVQAAPVLLDRERTVAKACDLIAEAGREGARLVVFPAAFVPGYPDWVWSVPAGNGEVLNTLYAQLLDQSVDIPGDSTRQLSAAARKAGVYVVMGLNERNVEASGCSLYNTLLYFGPDGGLLGKHRKLVPTGGERLVWAQGDGSTLGVYDTPFGRLSGLICWENYMPLARYALYSRGIRIYVAATWDDGDGWLSTLKHIAREGRVFVIGTCIALPRSAVPDTFPYQEQVYGAAPGGDAEQWLSAGDSAIVDPNGDFLAGPLRDREAILYADLDLQDLAGRRWLLDVAGHYSRPDVFELIVHGEPRNSRPSL